VGAHGRLVGSIGPAPWPADLDIGPVTRLQAEQRNTSFIADERVIAKLIRRVEPGLHPEIEIGRHLTGRVGFDGVPPLLGALEYEGNDGRRTALMVVHSCVPHRGTAWEQAMDELGRYFEAAAASSELPDPDSPEIFDRIGWYADAVTQLGRQTARLHHALATPAGDREFAPAPLTRTDLDRLQASPADGLPTGGLVIRTHGDYHLGQLLVRDAGFTIVDFEGNDALSIEDRRRRRSPLEDVAGILRSFVRAADLGLATWTERHSEHADRLYAWARAWEVAVEELFLRSYLESADAAWFPEGDGRDALLRMHLIARAGEN
jgi:maltose alpha-D-glucosyltransferase/alpha-amylase